MPVRSCFPLPIAVASTRTFKPTAPFRMETYSSRETFPSLKDLVTCQKITIYMEEIILAI